MLRQSAVVLLLAGASALRVPVASTRRDVLRLVAAAAIAPAAPAFAKSKASVQPNKPEGVGANAKSYQLEMYAKEKEGMAGDKGSRGTASAAFEASDTVMKNRRENKGVLRDERGNKVAVADRNRNPAELGLKTYSGP
jgi:predicted lipoprotein with Yx(FWY)xxD motif|eukprot:5707289-Prymnesium_polylepis.2